MDYNLCLVFHRAKQLMTSKDFPCHDYEHVLRVYKNVQMISQTEEADKYVVEPAAMMHDLGRADEFKDPSIDHALRSAELAEPILYEAGYAPYIADKVLQAIRQHRFSTGIVPDSIEGKVLQDADRLDALGAIGVMRWVSAINALNTLLYDPQDPFAERRVLDDKEYGIDHFYVKLLKLTGMMHTGSAKEIALARTEYMHGFLEQFRKEIYGLG